LLEIKGDGLDQSLGRLDWNGLESISKRSTQV
jgi:hypothetical protein